MFEYLESRKLMAVDVTLNSGNLQVRSSGENTTVEVEQLDNDSVIVYDGGFGVDQNPITYDCVNTVTIWGNNANDTIIYRGLTIGALIRGNTGADHIFVEDKGTGSSDVDGESDNDVITVVRSNHTTVTGGSGDDAIIINSIHNVDPSIDLSDTETIVIAGSGMDTITIYDGDVTVNGGSGADGVVLYADADNVTLIKVETVTNA